MNIKLLQSKELKNLCKTNKVKSLFAFGSVTRDDFDENSDINLVVDFDESDPFKYTDLYFNLKSKLEELFNRQIDLLEERAIRNKLFRQQLDSTKIRIYGHKSKPGCWTSTNPSMKSLNSWEISGNFQSTNVI